MSCHEFVSPFFKMCLFVVYFIVVFLTVYIFARLTLGIDRSPTCLAGKTALITGANSGIGYQTALNLASRGCRVIMADVADMENSKLNIIKYTNNSNIVTKKLDLSSLKSVRAFVADVLKTEENLHILINNAGIGTSTKDKTEDGLDPVMQINYFGHFLLTHLLIDLLKRSAPSRIVFTSSILAFINNLSLNNLIGVRNPSIKNFFTYGNSKTAVIIASDIFAEKLKGTGVTSNCVHPGLVDTKLFDKFLIILNRTYLLTAFKLLFIRKLFKDPWEGSQTLVNAAVSKELEQVTGKFFADCITIFKPFRVYNKRFCKEIWKMSEECVREA